MSKKQENKVDLTDTWKSSRITVFLGATGYTITLIAIIGGSTYYLDHLLGTSPTIFIIGLIVGFPLTQYLIYRKFKHFAADKTNQK